LLAAASTREEEAAATSRCLHTKKIKFTSVVVNCLLFATARYFGSLLCVCCRHSGRSKSDGLRAIVREREEKMESYSLYLRTREDFISFWLRVNKMPFGAASVSHFSSFAKKPKAKIQESRKLLTFQASSNSFFQRKMAVLNKGMKPFGPRTETTARMLIWLTAVEIIISPNCSRSRVHQSWAQPNALI
jgi:hypothetical protein